MTVLTAYNRTNMKMMFVMTAFFFVVAEGLFRIMFYNTVAKVRTYVQCIVCFTVLKNCLFIMCVSSTFSSSSFPYHSYFPSSLLPYSFSLPLLPCSLPLSPLLTSLIFYSPSSLSSTPQNALTFIPYFFTGTFAASVLENMHVAMWDWKRKEAVKAKSKQLLTLTPAVSSIS